jgi:hypothetical protein
MSACTPSLDSVRQKIFRVKQHFEELQQEINRYFQTNPGAMVLAPDSSVDNPTFFFQSAKPIPARFGLIAGDCLQNLRSSLDYLVWELVIAAGNQPSRKNMFPICSTLDAFNAALQRKRLEGVGPAPIAIIESMQPFQSGTIYTENLLWILDELTNINKHRRVLLTVLGSVVRAEIPAAESEGGVCGHPFAPERTENPRFVARKASGDARVNAKLHAFLVFNEALVRDQEIMTCLGTWTQYVGDTVISQFERFFS